MLTHECMDVGREDAETCSELRLIQDIAAGVWLLANGIVWHASTA